MTLPGRRKNVLGLGLALVARIVRNMDGRLVLKSEQGVGSCFKIKLRFPLPSQPDGRKKQAEKDESTKERQNPGVSEDGRFKPTEIRCENECSSRYGESIREANTDADISIAMDTASSEFIHHSGTKFTKDQNEHMLGSEAPSTPTTPRPSTTQSQSSTVQDSEQKQGTNESTHSIDRSNPTSLHVLVAEDDPINSTIARKRLEKLGHTVHLTANGKECATAYRENPSSYDALLMDIQVFSFHISSEIMLMCCIRCP